MATGRGHRRRDKDHISGLHDELLHSILLRLPSIAVAARTSILSRRWRRVWAHLPELRFDKNELTVDSVNGALAGYAGPILNRLTIDLCRASSRDVRAARVSPWLQFAAQRLAGELEIFLPISMENVDEDLELPICERVKVIDLILRDGIRLRLPPAGGTFMALTTLWIADARMESRELEGLVSTQCPRLKELSIYVLTLVTVSDVSIRSDSLRHLKFHDVQNSRRLEVCAPRLETLCVADVVEAYIAAPKLAEVVWDDDNYDPDLHQFVEAGRHLRRLEISLSSKIQMERLMRRFDTVHELSLDLSIPQGIESYKAFLKGTYGLPMCEVLVIKSTSRFHGCAPIAFHLLRRSTGIRKFSIDLYFKAGDPCALGCPCRLPKSCKTDNITLDSLEEVEINLSEGAKPADEQVEFVKLLLRCNAAKLKRVVVNISRCLPSTSKGICEEIRSMCSPNNKVEFIVRSQGS